MIYKCFLTGLAVFTLTACGSKDDTSAKEIPLPVITASPLATPIPEVSPSATPTISPTPVAFSIQLNKGVTTQTVVGCSPFSIEAAAAQGDLVEGYDFIFTPEAGVTAVTDGETINLMQQTETALFIADENETGTFDISVTYNDGEQDYSTSITLNVTENIACSETSGWAYNDFETLTTPNGLTIGNISQPYEDSGLASPIASLSLSTNEGMADISGGNTGAFLITVLTPDSVNSPTMGRGAGWYTNAFNQSNFWAQNFNTSDVGKKYGSSIWVKLNKLPSAEITLTQWIMPWLREGRDGTCFHFACGDSGGEIAVTATLTATTQWQYVEFPTIVVPDTFTTPGAATMAYIFRGPGIMAGDSFLMDNMAITKAE